MRRFAAVVVTTALANVPLLFVAPSASACSCAAPAPGDPHPEAIVRGVAGERTSSATWRFTVETVERGPVTPRQEISVEVTRGDEAGCGVSLPPLDPGRAYRVGGSFDEATHRLFLNLCSGALLVPLAGAAGEPATTAPSTVPDSTVTTTATAAALVAVVEENGRNGVDGRLAVGAIAGAAGAAAAALGLRRLVGGTPRG